MASNYSNFLYNDYQKLLSKFEKQEKLLKETNKLVKTLNKTIEVLNNSNEQLKRENDELKKEILKLKSKNNRDSSNSSKPSSTDGYKKVKTNNREKSDKEKGAQDGHQPHSLNNKLKQFIESGDIEEIIIDVNKNKNNENKRYIEKIVIDIKVTKVVKRYRYYPDEKGKYNIPKIHNQNVQYGPFVKAMCIDLMNHLPNSTDGVTSFISDITNNGMTISKGTLILWNEEIANILIPEINYIESSLLDSYYINHDESQIKIDGDGNNILCACNSTHTRLWVSEHKSQEAIKNIGFLPKYHGVIVKDGTELYNPFGLLLAQCSAHILRYLKPYYTEIKHEAPKLMKEFFSKKISRRNDLINNEKAKFEDNEYISIIKEYDSILDKWEKELREDVNNYLFNDEYCLWRRMKYDNKNMDSEYRGDRDEILYFLKDFNIPATNNAAESSQRPAKIKQKVGKFRSRNGADNYVIIRSCISTYKKNSTNVFKALVSAFKGIVAIV